MCQLPSSAVEEPIFASFLVIVHKVHFFYHSRYYFAQTPFIPLTIDAVTGVITLNASQATRVLDYETVKQYKVIVSLGVLYGVMTIDLIGLQLSSR